MTFMIIGDIARTHNRHGHFRQDGSGMESKVAITGQRRNSHLLFLVADNSGVKPTKTNLPRHENFLC